MKKPIAAVTALILFALTFACAVPAGAKTTLVTPYSLSDGTDRLRTQFQRGEVGGMDYNYFVPCDEKKDTGKYPLVLILCGIGEGYEEDQPINRHTFVNWSSIELQRRFSAGGAYIMLPRSPQDKGNFWYASTVPMLKACLDDFVKNHNVDTERIYVAGFSIGAKMLYQMVAAYPNYFAAAVVMSPYTYTTNVTPPVEALSKMPVWFFGSNRDLIVNYDADYKGVWDRIVAKSSDRAVCRLSTFTYTVTPDGEKVWNNHESWHAFCSDMFYKNEATGQFDSPWPYCSTENGEGKTVTLTYPNGMISWLNGCVRHNASSSTEGRTRMGFFRKLVDFFRRIISLITGLFR